MTKPPALRWIFIALNVGLLSIRKYGEQKCGDLQVGGDVKTITQASNEQSQTGTNLIIDRSIGYMNIGTHRICKGPTHPAKKAETANVA